MLTTDKMIGQDRRESTLEQYRSQLKAMVGLLGVSEALEIILTYYRDANGLSGDDTVVNFREDVLMASTRWYNAQ